MKEAIKFILFPILFICVHLQTNAQAKDTIFFKNGQLLIGLLKSISLGKITFDDDDLDIIEVKANKIKTISATTHVYKLESIDHKLYYTFLQTGSNDSIRITVVNNSQQFAIEDIGYLIPLRRKFKGLWEGSLSAGYSYTRSSAVGRFNSDLSVGYRTRKFEMITKGSLISTRTDSSNTIDNANAVFNVSYLFNPLWRADLLLNYQHNLELGLERRFLEGLAGGITVLTSEYTRGKILFGLALSEELSTEKEETPLQLEMPTIFLFDFYHFRKPDISLGTTQSLITSLTQWGRIRHDGQLNVRWKIITDFYINLQLYDNYDNQPPGKNAATFDYGVVFGLTYKFSQ